MTKSRQSGAYSATPTSSPWSSAWPTRISRIGSVIAGTVRRGPRPAAAARSPLPPPVPGRRHRTTAPATSAAMPNGPWPTATLRPSTTPLCVRQPRPKNKGRRASRSRRSPRYAGAAPELHGRVDTEHQLEPGLPRLSTGAGAGWTMRRALLRRRGELDPVFEESFFLVVTSRSSASTERATPRCCSRSRAWTTTRSPSGPGSWPRATGRHSRRPTGRRLPSDGSCRSRPPT